MGRLSTVKPRVQMANTSRVQPLPVVADRRITGRKLQDRRLKVWSKNPRCALCGRVCDFPSGFELDHKVPLYQGGADTEDNCQVLCVSFEMVEGQRVKAGCHAEKTLRDLQG